MESRRQLNIFKVLKADEWQPRSLYPVKIFCRNEGKIKAISNKGNRRESAMPKNAQTTAQLHSSHTLVK